MGRPMKDSGVEWIGEIPEDWEVTKLKTIFSILGGNGFPEHLQGNDSGDYPFYKNSDLSAEEDKCIYYAKNYVTAHVIDENKFRVIPAESIIMSKIGEAMKKNHRKINVADCLIDNNLQALSIKNKTKYHLGFYFYVMCLIDSAIFDNRGTIPSINNNMLRNEYILYPMINKQKKIAAFLDRKTTHINGIVEKTKASIDAFKRYKQALITETVTKGLNPDVPMKDSRIEWIGIIPKHWEISKIKYTGKLRNEKSLYQKGDQYVGLEHIEGFSGRIHSFSDDYEEKLTDSFREGDVLFSKLRPYLTKGFIAEFNGFCSGELLTFEKVEGNKKYFLYYLLSSNFIDAINASTYGTKMPRASWDFIKELAIPKIPIEEQHQIVAFLDEKTANIDSLIQNKEAMIEKLEEYKKSLIYEYVTGKKEVE